MSFVKWFYFVIIIIILKRNFQIIHKTAPYQIYYLMWKKDSIER